jgi:hypothetical protein
MSAWKVSFELVPKAGIIRVHGCVPEHISVPKAKPHHSLDDLHSITNALPNYWVGVKLSDDGFLTLLPERKSWSRQAMMFGKPDGDAVEIWQGPTGIERLKVCYNLDDCSLPFVHRSIEAADHEGCLFHSTESGNLLEPSLRLLDEEIGRLRQDRYLVNWRDMLNHPPDSPSTPRG